MDNKKTYAYVGGVDVLGGSVVFLIRRVVFIVFLIVVAAVVAVSFLQLDENSVVVIWRGGRSRQLEIHEDLRDSQGCDWSPFRADTHRGGQTRSGSCPCFLLWSRCCASSNFYRRGVSDLCDKDLLLCCFYFNDNERWDRKHKDRTVHEALL